METRKHGQRLNHVDLILRPLQYEVLYRADILGVGTDNPTLMGWRKLLEYGFPFAKATIIKNPETAPHGYDVARVVKELYAVDLDEWV